MWRYCFLVWWLEIFIVFFFVHQLVGLVGFAELHFEQPSLVVCRTVDKRRRFFDIGILFGDCARNRWIQFTGRFHTFQCAAFVALCQNGTNIGQLCKYNITKGFLQQQQQQQQQKKKADNNNHVIYNFELRVKQTNFCRIRFVTYLSIVWNSNHTNFTIYLNPFVFLRVFSTYEYQLTDSFLCILRSMKVAKKSTWNLSYL